MEKNDPWWSPIGHGTDSLSTFVNSIHAGATTNTKFKRCNPSPSHPLYRSETWNLQASSVLSRVWMESSTQLSEGALLA